MVKGQRLAVIDHWLALICCTAFTHINLDNSAENIDFILQTDTADETDITCLPKPFTSLFDRTAVNLGNEDLTSLLQRYIFTIPSGIQTKIMII